MIGVSQHGEGLSITGIRSPEKLHDKNIPQ
jgi:hypothetical protein